MTIVLVCILWNSHGNYQQLIRKFKPYEEHSLIHVLFVLVLAEIEPTSSRAR